MSEQPQYAGQQAVVIGAGQGMGRALAARAVEQGFQVSLLARHQGALDVLAAQLATDGTSPWTATVDASDPDQVARTVRSLAERAPIGALLYNAAASGGPLAETTTTDAQRSLAVNVLSPLAAVQAALPDLRKARGLVLLTGGGLALYPNAAYGVLSLGKAALRTAALLLADDLSPLGVRVRTLTIAGTVAAGTAFDPDLIAEAFWALAGGTAVESVFDGSPRTKG